MYFCLSQMELKRISLHHTAAVSVFSYTNLEKAIALLQRTDRKSLIHQTIVSSEQLYCIMHLYRKYRVCAALLIKCTFFEQMQLLMAIFSRPVLAFRRVISSFQKKTWFMPSALSYARIQFSCILIICRSAHCVSTDTPTPSKRPTSLLQKTGWLFF